MILIIATQYVNAEFQSEVGLLPPCLLPIGNKKLLELQVAVIKQQFSEEKIIVALPESYELTLSELHMMAELGVDVQAVPDKFSFAESILYVLNMQIDKRFDHVRVLQGEMLIESLPQASDVIARAAAREYSWQDKKRLTGKEANWAGYFSFSSRLDLIKALATAKGSFVKTVRRYQQFVPMTEVMVSDYYDCGHISTFMHARATITTQRAFNALTIIGGVVTKSSDDDLKIQAEIFWFNHLPMSLRRFTPQFIDSGKLDNAVTFYCLEYLPLLPLNEIYVHARNPVGFWQQIFGLAKEYFALARTPSLLNDINQEQIANSANHLYADKTRSRLQRFSDTTGYDLDQPIVYQAHYLGTTRQICEDCIEKVRQLPCVASVLHGDLCFSNMLFDSRGRRLKLIDPRGIDHFNQFSIFGNQSYDLAKLAHSVIGMYDFIIAGRYQLVADLPNTLVNESTDDITQGLAIVFDQDERLMQIQNQFFATEFIDGFSTLAIMPAVTLLFLSMLPLHADRPDRQQAMLINAYRLYHEFVLNNAVMLEAGALCL